MLSIKLSKFLKVSIQLFLDNVDFVVVIVLVPFTKYYN